MSRASGAGAYSHSSVAGAACRFSTSVIDSPSVDREVVEGLVDAGLLLADLHQHVVEQRRRAEAEEVGRHPVTAERLVEDAEVLDRLLGGTDPTGRLHSDDPSGFVV